MGYNNSELILLGIFRNGFQTCQCLLYILYTTRLRHIKKHVFTAYILF